jgi:hypothetical protein
VLVKKRAIALGLLVTAAACSADSGNSVVRGNGRGAAGSGQTAGPANNGLITPSGTTTGPSGNIIGTAGRSGAKLTDPNVCASADVTATRITPTVYLVIDGSSSMNARFGGGTRWSVLRDAVVGTNGVVTKLDPVVKFGMSIYSNNDPMKCPATVNVPAALSNLKAINTSYPAMETGGGTPTGEALQQVVDGLPDFNSLDAQGAPPIIILATDGEPNGCSGGAVCDWTDWANCLGMLLGSLANAPANYESTLKAVRAARDKNIAVWVVSLAEGLNNIPDLQKTANIGAGLADNAMPGATIYSPQNPDDLTTTLAKLIGAAVTCNVELAGKLDVKRACEGRVLMNGQALECGSDQGWKPVDTGHIELQGNACERFKSDPAVMLDATFPCDVVVPG